jgi:hypothetical protein
VADGLELGSAGFGGTAHLASAASQGRSGTIFVTGDLASVVYRPHAAGCLRTTASDGLESVNRRVLVLVKPIGCSGENLAFVTHSCRRTDEFGGAGV